MRNYALGIYSILRSWASGEVDNMDSQLFNADDGESTTTAKEAKQSFNHEVDRMIRELTKLKTELGRDGINKFFSNNGISEDF